MKEVFREIRIFTTVKGFIQVETQKSYQELAKVCDIDYSLPDIGMVSIMIGMNSIKTEAGKHLLSFLRALENFRQPYDCDYGCGQSDYGSYSRIYRPDQNFGKFAFQGNEHLIIQYNEVNANEVYQDYRKAIQLLKQGESGKAREFLASCVPPTVKDIEEYSAMGAC